MTTPNVTVRVAMPGVDRMANSLDDPSEVSQEIANAWMILYRSFVRLRFLNYSRGRGDWPALKESTLKRRRKGKKGSKSEGQGAAILRDTGALFASLQPASGGLLNPTTIPFGLKVSFGGGERYDDGATLVQVATFHHLGGGRLPKRIILALPDNSTHAKMAAVGHKIIVRHLNGS